MITKNWLQISHPEIEKKLVASLENKGIICKNDKIVIKNLKYINYKELLEYRRNCKDAGFYLNNECLFRFSLNKYNVQEWDKPKIKQYVGHK